MGNTQANFYLGLLYDFWYGYPELDYGKARVYYEASGEHPCAQLALGFLYYNGYGVERDTAKAREMFEDVITGGCVEGHLSNAKMAFADQNYGITLEYYHEVLKGDEQVYTAYAMYAIGYLYHEGLGVEQDLSKAREWYEQSAAAKAGQDS